MTLNLGSSSRRLSWWYRQSPHLDRPLCCVKRSIILQRQLVGALEPTVTVECTCSWAGVDDRSDTQLVVGEHVASNLSLSKAQQHFTQHVQSVLLQRELLLLFSALSSAIIKFALCSAQLTETLYLSAAFMLDPLSVTKKQRCAASSSRNLDKISHCGLIASILAQWQSPRETQGAGSVRFL